MLRLLLLVGFMSAWSDARGQEADPLAGAPQPLAEAVRKVAADAGRWAYAQKMVQYDGKGKLREKTVARFDPSQPYDQQWTLVEKDGKAATESQQRRFRKERSDRARNRQTLGELLMLDQATIVDESAATLVYEVPLRKIEGGRLPPEKFKVLMHVDRAAQTLALIEIKLRDSLRVAGVLKVKGGDGYIRFEEVKEGFAPAATDIQLGASGTIAFVKVGTRTEARRTEFRRVKPYDERFQVQIGPLKALDF